KTERKQRIVHVDLLSLAFLPMFYHKTILNRHEEAHFQGWPDVMAYAWQILTMPRDRFASRPKLTSLFLRYKFLERYWRKIVQYDPVDPDRKEVLIPTDLPTSSGSPLHFIAALSFLRRSA